MFVRECLNPSFAEHDRRRLLIDPDLSLDQLLPGQLSGTAAKVKNDLLLSTQSGLLVNWTHGPQADIQHRLTTRARRTICRDCRRCCWLRCSRRIASSRHTERGFCWVWMYLPALLLLVADAVFNLLIASSASRPSPSSSQRVRNVIRSSASPNCLGNARLVDQPR